MTARRAPPFDALLALAESVTLAGCDALATGAEVRSFDQIADWLDESDHAKPLRRIVQGFELERAECALLVLLFAAAMSEQVARTIAVATTASGQGVPVWFAQRLIPDLRAD